MTQTHLLPAFYRELAKGNIALAFQSALDSLGVHNQYYLCDIIDAFSETIRTRAYHSAQVCRGICKRLITEFSGNLPVQKLEELRTVPIPEPEHPGIVFPLISDSGQSGMLFYAVIDPGKIKHQGRCFEHPFSDSLKHKFPEIRDTLSSAWYGWELPHYNNIGRYHLKPVSGGDPVFPKETELDSAALAMALALASLAINKLPSHFPWFKTPVAATGCWESGQFLPVCKETIQAKFDLIHREIPELATFLTSNDSTINGPGSVQVIQVSSSENLLEPVRNHIFKMNRKLPSDEFLLEEEAEFFSNGFERTKKHFQFKEALKYADSLLQILKVESIEFESDFKHFYPAYVALLSSIYNFNKANSIAVNIDYGMYHPKKDRLIQCILAERYLLQHDLDYEKRAQEIDYYLERAAYTINFTKPYQEHRNRYLIYRFRFDLMKENSDCDKIVSNIQLHFPEEKPNNSGDMPYWYYILIRALFLAGRYQEAFDTTIKAEKKYFNTNKSIWPGILWRRHGARAAEKIGRFTEAEKWLRKPLPAPYCHRTILKIHQAASELLWWAISHHTAKSENSPSLETICWPFRDSLVGNYFENHVNSLIDMHRKRIDFNGIRQQIESIVVRSYE